MRYVRISKSEAKKRFAASEPVYLCPCKMFPDGPFSLAYLVFGKEHMEDAKRYANSPNLWKGSIVETGWSLMYNRWHFYNTSYETGYYPHYYVTIDE